MFEEHDQIVLTVAVTGDDGEELRQGDVGVIVHVHPGGEAFVAEFTSLDGDMIAIATVLPSQARPVTAADLTHTHIASRPSVGAVLDGIRKRKAAKGGWVSPSTILQARDADRK